MYAKEKEKKVKLFFKSLTIIAALVAVCFLGSVIITGCTAPQQQVTFNTLYTVEHATVSAYDGYIELVIAGTVPTNGVPVVSKAFNAFQQSFLIALDVAQFNTNAIAPPSLVMESQNVINIITVNEKAIK
jgi:hypothetical protein